MHKTKIFIGFGTHMITDLYSSFVVGMLPVLFVKHGLSLFLVSILTSVNFVSGSMIQPVFGFLSDKYGIKNFLIMGPLLASVFISLLGIAPTYWVILIFLFLGNLGVAAIHPPSAAMANFFGGQKKGFANSLISFGGSFGFSLGSLFVIFIIKKFGMEFTPIAAIPGLITAVVMVKFAPEIDVQNYTVCTISFTERLKKVKKSRIGILLIIFLVTYTRDIITLTLLTFMPLYYTDRGIKLIDFGYIIMAFTLIGGIGGLFAGFYSDRIQKRTLVMQILLLISIPCIFAIFLVPVHISIVFFILVGFFSISTHPLCIREAQDIFPRNVSLASSLSLGTAAGSAAVTVILIGKIADVAGIVKTIMYMTILPVVAVLILILFPFLKERTK